MVYISPPFFRIFSQQWCPLSIPEAKKSRDQILLSRYGAQTVYGQIARMNSLCIRIITSFFIQPKCQWQRRITMLNDNCFYFHTLIPHTHTHTQETLFVIKNPSEMFTRCRYIYRRKKWSNSIANLLTITYSHKVHTEKKPIKTTREQKKMQTQHNKTSAQQQQNISIFSIRPAGTENWY